MWDGDANYSESDSRRRARRSTLHAIEFAPCHTWNILQCADSWTAGMLWICSGSHLPLSYLPALINWALQRQRTPRRRQRQRQLSNGRQAPADIISIMSFTGQLHLRLRLRRRFQLWLWQPLRCSELYYARAGGVAAACNRFVSHFICHNFRLIFMSIIKLRWWAKLHSERCMKGAALPRLPEHIYHYIHTYTGGSGGEESRQTQPNPSQRFASDPREARTQMQATNQVQGAAVAGPEINLRSFAPLFSPINSMRKPPKKILQWNSAISPCPKLWKIQKNKVQRFCKFCY